MERHGRERGVPATVTQLADALGLPVDRVTQALKALVSDAHVEHIARGYYVLRKTQDGRAVTWQMRLDEPSAE